jgi:hypothetical protein
LNPTKKESDKKSSGRKTRRSVLDPRGFIWLSLVVLFCGSPSLAQSPQFPETGASAGQQQPVQESSGGVGGTIADQSGAAIAGARVTLTREDQSSNQEVLSANDGQFSFINIAPGPFQLTITAAGFATQISSGTLRSGEIDIVPRITLAIAPSDTEVRVEPSRAEVAEAQIKDEEKQRLAGLVPNFYVSYIPNAVALTSKQKFELAWETTVDPATFVLVGAIAGIEQAQNDFSGYGQGAQGYGKRYGANYADSAVGTFVGGAILPSLLKQDPRYFYKGSGAVRSRILYAMANAVICKGDNGHWQPNYSGILGSLAAGGISNLYYPATNRDGARLTVENTLIGIGVGAAANLLQEFVIRKLTTGIPNHSPAKS